MKKEEDYIYKALVRDFSEFLVFACLDISLLNFTLLIIYLMMYFFPSTLFFDWEIGIDIYDRFPLDDIFQRGLEKQDYA